MLVCETTTCTTAAHLYCYFVRGSAEVEDWEGDMGLWTCHLCTGNVIPALAHRSQMAPSAHLDMSENVAGADPQATSAMAGERAAGSHGSSMIKSRSKEPQESSGQPQELAAALQAKGTVAR